MPDGSESPADPRPVGAPPARDLARRARGCLLGGALGDALGAPVEFLTLEAIRASYGPRGVEKLERVYGRVGAITDDTQMTLFTAEGLVRAWVRGKTRGIGHPASVVHHAYRRWLRTQQEAAARAARGRRKPARSRRSRSGETDSEVDGWLVAERALHARRAPGTTCLSALEAPVGLGVPATNRSKGCGGVMRSAPVGLLDAPGSGDEPTPAEGIFRLAVETAALTHGHPTGQLAAGVLAATIHGVVHGGLRLERALDEATAILVRRPHQQETARALGAARELAAQGEPSAEKLETLGAGWVAEEALAIAVYAALCRAADLRSALILAANHSGDSDSTAAICGNLLGAVLGEEALPADWLAQLEARDIVTQLADDLAAEILHLSPTSVRDDPDHAAEWDAWSQKYPPW